MAAMLAFTNTSDMPFISLNRSYAEATAVSHALVLSTRLFHASDASILSFFVISTL